MPFAIALLVWFEVESGAFEKLERPSPGKISSGYGYRYGVFHSGIDFLPNQGGEVKAAAEGAVINTSTKGECGKTVIIYHGQKLSTWYCHLNRIYVSVGDVVEKGKIIAEMGSTGKSTDTHLHFEVRIGSEHVDPMMYLVDEKGK